jgi:hypothetical protein
MNRLARGYDALIHGMAWLAGTLLALMFFAIVVDVLRTCSRSPSTRC